MKRQSRITVGILALVGAISLVMATGAAGIPDPGNGAGSPFIGTAPDSLADSTHRIGTIRYYHASVGGVSRNTLPGSHEITIGTNDVLVLKVPALVSGGAGTKGMLMIGDDDLDVVYYSLLLSPGKWGMLKTTNPPMRWTVPGVHHVIVQVVAPGGGTSFTAITVTVV